MKISIEQLRSVINEVIAGEIPDVSPGEKCSDCDQDLELQVCRSAAGYYIGRRCNCGPYSRNSGYFRSYEAAQQQLDQGHFER